MTSPLGTGPFVPSGASGSTSDALGIDRIESILARLPDAANELIAGLRTIVSSGEFVSSATEIRRAGEAAAWYALSPTNHISWLTEHGFTREDARQIRYLAEVIYSQEPANAFIAALALRAVDVDCLSAYEPRADAGFLVDWPEYRMRVRNEIWVSVQTGEYDSAVSSMLARVWRISAVARVQPLQADCPYLAPSLRDCIGQSCERLIAACGLRRMFIRAETAGRRAS